jgi:hypothetical protein
MSPDMIFYSEEIFYYGPNTILESKVPLWKREYSETAHVDSMKVRHFSPVQKGVMGEADETNPIVGKSRDFSRKMEWLPEKFKIFKAFLWDRFKYRFNKYADWNDPFTYLPMELGGLGLSGLIDPCELDVMLSNENPLIIRGLNEIISGRGQTSTRANLNSYRTNTSYRGLVQKMDASEQIYGALGNMDSEKKTIEQIKEIFVQENTHLNDSEQVWNFLRHRDRKKFATKCGYIAISDVLAEVERPTYFKQVLVGESDIINAQPEMARFKFYENVMIKICREDGISLQEALDSNEYTFDSSYYKESRAAAAQKKWDIELFTSDLAAGKECPEFMKNIEREIQTSFNTTPWDVRKSKMVDTFIRHPPIGEPIIGTILEVFNGRKKIIHNDDFFVPIDRLRKTCSLRTPLKIKLSPQTEADPLPQEISESILKRKARCLQGLPGNA